ncbi:MAG: homoprotocatechuate degradation operon regulator HpaR, partial [Pseudorhodoplanes sp.]
MTRSMRPFERSLPMQLMLAREAVMQRFRPHLTARGLTDQQWRIVRALNEVETIEIADLGRVCCL